MTDYTGYGNEKLKPLALSGNADAERELNNRGNFLTPEGGLKKTYVRTDRKYQGNLLISENVIEEDVIDGKRVEVRIDGVVQDTEVPAP